MSADAHVLAYLNGRRDELFSLARDIWGHPELGFKETYASDALARAFAEAGFLVRKPVADIPTAFVAEWGSGTPVIGVLGEYDALPGLSQKVSTVREPVVDGGPGHGCGHNLLGVAGFGAALAAKAAMESSGLKGTIRYFGCPAEETLMGKVFMARDGVFDGLDVALTWHPMYANTVWAAASTALNSFKLSFHGRSAHAAGAPEAGRSALDAVVLTEVGVNFLREHMSSEYRIHCVITHGGEAPNIVPAFAQSWYYVRAPNRSQVEEMYQRVLNVARGAALMTDTTLEVKLVAACYDFLSNETVEKVLLNNMRKVGAPSFDDSDLRFARQLQTTLPEGGIDDTLRALGRTRSRLVTLCARPCLTMSPILREARCSRSRRTWATCRTLCRRLSSRHAAYLSACRYTRGRRWLRPVLHRLEVYAILRQGTCPHGSRPDAAPGPPASCICGV